MKWVKTLPWCNSFVHAQGSGNSSSCLRLRQRRDISWSVIAGTEGHTFRHFNGVRVAQVPIGLGDKITSIRVAKPARDNFEINPRLDCIAAKIMAHGMMEEGGQLRLLAGIFYCRRRPNRERNYSLIWNGLTLTTDAFEQFAHGGKQRDHANLVVLGAAFPARDREHTTLEINVAQHRVKASPSRIPE